MNIIKHKSLIRDLILHSDESNIDIIMNIMTMFENVEECNPDIMKLCWYSNGSNNVLIKITSNEYCYIIKFYHKKIQICTINNKSTKWNNITYDECRNFLRTLASQSNILLDSKYEVGVSVG